MSNISICLWDILTKKGSMYKCLAISLNFRRYLEPKLPELELEGNSSPQRPANFFFTGHSTPVALWRNTCQWRSNPPEGASYPHHFASLSASQIERILFRWWPRDSKNPRDRGKRRDARNREVLVAPGTIDGIVNADEILSGQGRSFPLANYNRDVSMKVTWRTCSATNGNETLFIRRILQCS